MKLEKSYRLNFQNFQIIIYFIPDIGALESKKKFPIISSYCEYNMNFLKLILCYNYALVISIMSINTSGKALRW